MNTTAADTVGIDLAKNVFSLCILDSGGRVKGRLQLRRAKLAEWLAQQPPGLVVAMETCGGAHYWARLCERLGLKARLVSAWLVWPFRKSTRIKNDANDAEAIATAARQGNMRFVAIKSEDQQVRLANHALREGYKKEKLAATNRIRGLLLEFGVAIPKTQAALREALPEVLDNPELPLALKVLLAEQQAHVRYLDERIHACEQRIAEQVKQDDRCRRIQAMTGVGPVTADAIVASIGEGKSYANGRQFAASQGLVPGQHSTGGRSRLGHITRTGDGYLRTLLIQGARSTVQVAENTPDERATPEQLWIKALLRRQSIFGKVLVAVANKHARQIWAMLARGEDYDRLAALKHPLAMVNNQLAQA